MDYSSSSFPPLKKKHDRHLKRSRTEEIKVKHQPDQYPKFLVVHSVDENSPIKNKSVFLIAKCLENVIGEDYNAKKLSSGDLLVEVTRKQQSDALLKQNSLADLTVTVTPHRSLNSIQGVISEHELLTETESDLLDGLRGQGVTALRRITIRRGGEEIKTKHIVLTFNRTTLPESVHAAFISCRVRPYVPNPRRCFKCQRYGHGTQTCRGRLTCAKCSDHDHAADDCSSKEAKCVNCHGPHAAYSRSCDTFKKEKQIIQLKVTENISFPEARKKHAFLSASTYANAARRGRGCVWSLQERSTALLTCFCPRPSLSGPQLLQRWPSHRPSL